MCYKTDRNGAEGASSAPSIAGRRFIGACQRLLESVGATASNLPASLSHLLTAANYARVQHGGKHGVMFCPNLGELHRGTVERNLQSGQRRGMWCF